VFGVRCWEDNAVCFSKRLLTARVTGLRDRQAKAVKDCGFAGGFAILEDTGGLATRRLQVTEASPEREALSSVGCCLGVRR
jgi:hypothetical protein